MVWKDLFLHSLFRLLLWILYRSFSLLNTSVVLPMHKGVSTPSLPLIFYLCHGVIFPRNQNKSLLMQSSEIPWPSQGSMSLMPCGQWLVYVLRHVGLHPLDGVGCLVQLLFMDMGGAQRWTLLCWWNPCSWFLFPLGCVIAFCESLADLCFPALGISRIPVLPSVEFQTSSSCSTMLLMHL